MYFICAFYHFCFCIQQFIQKLTWINLQIFIKVLKKNRLLGNFQARSRHVVFLNPLYNFGVNQIAGRAAQSLIMSRDQNREKKNSYFHIFTCESFLKFRNLFLKEIFLKNESARPTRLSGNKHIWFQKACKTLRWYLTVMIKGGLYSKVLKV